MKPLRKDASLTDKQRRISNVIEEHFNMEIENKEKEMRLVEYRIMQIEHIMSVLKEVWDKDPSRFHPDESDYESDEVSESEPIVKTTPVVITPQPEPLKHKKREEEKTNGEEKKKTKNVNKKR